MKARQILHRESGHVDFARRSDEGLHCTWCDVAPTYRVLWHSYTYGELVCKVHADMLARYGARVTPRYTLSSVQAGRTA